MKVSAMANLNSLNHRLLSALFLFSTLLYSSRLGNAQVTSPETAVAAAGVLQNEYYPQTGGTITGGSNQGNPGYFPGTGGSNEENPEYFPGNGIAEGSGSGSGENPDHIVTQALLCFNEKQIYSSCSEGYRLSQTGELHVLPENTDEYCSSPCISETHLVLNCIENLLSHFKFYNKASINDVRETIKSGCSYGPKRGDFNVAEHIQAEFNAAAEKSWRSCNLFLQGILLLIIVLECHFFWL